jgi:arylsulfatase A-like enzyme
MKSALRIKCLCLLLALPGLIASTALAQTVPARRPNVLFIVADDLGYGDLGCYGQKKIQTPNLDRLAAEGTRFTQAYAGTAVCAPSRCSLMTGKHTGHATVRGNQSPEMSLTESDFTIPQVFKAAGYGTALIGKWGLGGVDTPGAPNRKGFDWFFGFPSQTAAHNYYPPFLMRNSEKVILPTNQSRSKRPYAHDEFMDNAFDFLGSFNQSYSFFLELAVTIPHANNEERPNGMQVPSDAPYSNEDWPQTEKNFGAMITYLDTSVGQLMAFLKRMGIDETNTLVIFTSDNGPHSEGGHNAAFFDSSGGLRGIKRDLYEGGVRVPLIVRWPGKVKAGAVSDQVIAFWDWLPTFAAFTGQPAPKGVDGISVLPALLENEKVLHPPLYWEFHEGGFRRAVRMGNWKGVSLEPGQPLELYDLATDPAEKKNVAAKRADIVRQIEALMNREHVPDPNWPDRTPGVVQP